MDGQESHATLWIVVSKSGLDQYSPGQGVPVREKESFVGNVYKQQLGIGSVVREIERVACQVHYEIVQGNGPEEGWVSVHQADFQSHNACSLRKLDANECENLGIQIAKPVAMQQLALVPKKPGHRFGKKKWNEPTLLLEELKDAQKGITAARSDQEWLRNDMAIRDESGFVCNDDDPLCYISEKERCRSDGVTYVVVYERVAVRRTADHKGSVLGVILSGTFLRLFEWDLTNTWRKMHFTLRGGWGGTVQAWVMIEHPKLGTLLKQVGQEVIQDQSVHVTESNCEPEEYEVVKKRVLMRKDPQEDSQIFGIAKMGEHLQLFEWDQTRTYRKTFHSQGIGSSVPAWVMVSHPDMGDLLQPCKNTGRISTACKKCGKIEEGMGDVGLCDACFTNSFDL